jgi:hypothetical protein
VAGALDGAVLVPLVLPGGVGGVGEPADVVGAADVVAAVVVALDEETGADEEAGADEEVDVEGAALVVGPFGGVGAGVVGRPAGTGPLPSVAPVDVAEVALVRELEPARPVAGADVVVSARPNAVGPSRLSATELVDDFGAGPGGADVDALGTSAHAATPHTIAAMLAPATTRGPRPGAEVVSASSRSTATAGPNSGTTFSGRWRPAMIDQPRSSPSEPPP